MMPPVLSGQAILGDIEYLQEATELGPAKKQLDLVLQSLKNDKVDGSGSGVYDQDSILNMTLDEVRAFSAQYSRALNKHRAQEAESLFDSASRVVYAQSLLRQTKEEADAMMKPLDDLEKMSRELSLTFR